jgi:hypothetical protein
MTLDGIANIITPIIMTMDPIILPLGELGTTSPYPTVQSVVTAQYIASNIDCIGERRRSPAPDSYVHVSVGESKVPSAFST